MESAWRGTAGAAASAPCTMRSRCEKRKGAPCTRSHRNLANLFVLQLQLCKDAFDDTTQIYHHTTMMLTYPASCWQSS